MILSIKKVAKLLSGSMLSKVMKNVTPKLNILLDGNDRKNIDPKFEAFIT
jgi:hypothetical protein